MSNATNISVEAVPTVFEEGSYHIVLAGRYIGLVSWNGTREELEAWIHPNAILDRLRNNNYHLTDTELEIISLLA